MKKPTEFKSRKEWEDALWEDFLERVTKAGRGGKIKTLLNSILSESEKRLIIRRLVVISLIRKGKTYKEIGEILWLSPTTISSIKKSLKSGLIYQSRRDLKKKEGKRYSDTEPERRGGSADSLLAIIDYIDYWLSVMPPISGKGRWKFLDSRR